MACKAPPRLAPAYVRAARPSDLDAAFTTAFGALPPAVRIVKRNDEDFTLRYRPVRLVSLGAVTALISEARSDGCHGCYGALAVHYLARTPEGFKVLNAWPELIDGGSFGEPPRWSLRDDLFSGPVIEAHAGGTWQGCTVDYINLVELGAARPINRAQHVLAYYDDETHTDSGIEGKLRAVTRDRAFAVDYSGARTRTVEYKPTGEVFSPAHDEPGLPSC